MGLETQALRLAVTAVFCAGLPLAAASGWAAEEVACLDCHGDPELSLELPSGETVSLHVDQAAFEASVHGDGLRCLDCHPGLDELPHPERPARTLAEFRAGFREACKSCHFDTYTKSFDSVHYEIVARGDTFGPWCADCHGAHAVAPPGTPRTRISETCARCHEGVYGTYRKSVHGHALVEEANPDVPVCNDCHRSHDISDPRAREWLLRTPQLCGSCHTNAAMMQKYGLSTSVVDTYLADFHGVTAAFSKDEANPASGRVTALCIDCHGVHDIGPVDAPGASGLKQNLVRTCRQCHEGASEAFPAAWLSHYEPTWQKAPLVYSIKLFYQIFIPFIIGGLVLQILLHLWRVVVNR
jgi:predicted CXXCH cytochrome family protein